MKSWNDEILYTTPSSNNETINSANRASQA
jgi:hypothetical protein